MLRFGDVIGEPIRSGGCVAGPGEPGSGAAEHRCSALWVQMKPFCTLALRVAPCCGFDKTFIWEFSGLSSKGALEWWDVTRVRSRRRTATLPL